MFWNALTNPISIWDINHPNQLTTILSDLKKITSFHVINDILDKFMDFPQTCRYITSMTNTPGVNFLHYICHLLLYISQKVEIKTKFPKYLNILEIFFSTTTMT